MVESKRPGRATREDLKELPIGNWQSAIGNVTMSPEDNENIRGQ